ncbi:uncharacterized protein [Apostichopus japonicus]|uniref:uncharacterized protein n=1 Tax=Stichopus japonicus TaxID=307972 RepID=UPI003AB5CF22
MALFGKLDEFHGNSDDWTQYIERLTHYFLANEITDEMKKRSILLTVIGPDSYKLLRNRISPEKPGDKKFQELVDIMGKHQNLAPSEILQRCKFNSRFRQAGESVSSFVAELRSLAEFCNFGDALNIMLRDRLVCGINDDKIQRSLLSHAKLTFDTALEISLGLELASKNADGLKQAFNQHIGMSTSRDQVLQIPKGKGQRHPKDKFTARVKKFHPCYRCGRSNHQSDDCYFKEKTYNSCQKKGHISKVCRSKAVNQIAEDTKSSHQSPGNSEGVLRGSSIGGRASRVVGRVSVPRRYSNNRTYRSGSPQHSEGSTREITKSRSAFEEVQVYFPRPIGGIS